MKLSIIIPVFNEKRTVLEILKKIERTNAGIPKEIVVVDDGSSDGTRDILRTLSPENYKIIFKEKNEGKGAALRRGLKECTGDFVLIQDADLEYDPAEYSNLLEPILDGRADVVYGSRFVGNRPHRVLYNSHFLANKFLTFLSNLFTGLNLSDMETCYKVFTKNAVEKMLPRLTSNKFGIEPELTAEVAKHNFKIFEVGISYNGRTYEEGKKINWKDGVATIFHILRFNLFRRKPNGGK